MLPFPDHALPVLARAVVAGFAGLLLTSVMGR